MEYLTNSFKVVPNYKWRSVYKKFMNSVNILLKILWIITQIEIYICKKHGCFLKMLLIVPKHNNMSAKKNLLICPEQLKLYIYLSIKIQKIIVKVKLVH